MINKNIKMIMAITILLIISISICFYIGIYKPLESETKALTVDVALLEAQIDKYDIDIEQLNTIKDNQEVEVEGEDETIEQTIDFSKLPVDIREQDQILFFLELQEFNGLTLSSLTMGSDSSLATMAEFSIKQKNMSFTYRADNYEYFKEFFAVVQSNDSYPSSITNFSMDITEDGSVNGQIYLNNYYIQGETLDRSYTIDDSKMIGNVEIFAYE